VKLPDPPLLLVTDFRQTRIAPTEVIAAALAAGCRWISLREKDRSDPEQAAMLGALLKQAGPYGAKVMLHGDPEIARRTGADGVHRHAGGDMATARRVMGVDALVGASVHDVEAAGAAAPELVDYVIAGPAFSTPSKPDYGPPLVPTAFAAIANVCRVPVVAIGGIGPANLHECLRAGATGIAVMGGVMRASDPGREVRALISVLDAFRYQRPR
jgi:thiamine-phosphate pyrophosphorylase